MQRADLDELTQKLSGQPISMLIADDSESNQELLSLYFQKTTCKIDFAANGQEAVDKFAAKRYDLVLMDILMPVMDGLDATRAIRAHEKENGLEPVPIIAVTANAFDVDKKRSLDAGCTEFLPKPIRKKDIFTCIAKTMGRI